MFKWVIEVLIDTLSSFARVWPWYSTDLLREDLVLCSRCEMCVTHVIALAIGSTLMLRNTLIDSILIVYAFWIAIFDWIYGFCIFIWIEFQFRACFYSFLTVLDSATMLLLAQAWSTHILLWRIERANNRMVGEIKRVFVALFLLFSCLIYVLITVKMLEACTGGVVRTTIIGTSLALVIVPI